MQITTDAPLREGYDYQTRYGTTTIIAVTEKQVWYSDHRGTRRCSKEEFCRKVERSEELRSSENWDTEEFIDQTRTLSQWR